MARHVMLLALACGLSTGAVADADPDDTWDYQLTHAQQLKVALPVYGGVAIGSSLAGDASRTGGLFGFGFDFWYGRRTWSLEIGVLSVSKGYGLSGTTANLEYVQIPLIWRWTWWNTLSLGVGGYAAPVTVAANTKTGTVATDSTDFSGDYGLVFSLRYARRILPKVRLGVEGRYNLGLSNVSRTGTQQLRTWLVLATLEFGLW
ncbi:MAG: outer membrane beta-barrel protein [Bdellovibrionales bacterium]|nr:outer membrane beta-barrel protein [Bdellovibrionales bacterium]